MTLKCKGNAFLVSEKKEDERIKTVAFHIRDDGSDFGNGDVDIMKLIAREMGEELRHDLEG